MAAAQHRMSVAKVMMPNTSRKPSHKMSKVFADFPAQNSRRLSHVDTNNLVMPAEIDMDRKTSHYFIDKILREEQEKEVESSMSGMVEDEIPSGAWMLSPESTTRRYWDMLVAACCIYIAWILPFKLGFGDMVPTTWEEDHLYEFDTLVDVIFVVDLALSFRTAYWDDNDHLIWDKKKVALHYLASWFIIDLVGSFPFSVLQGGSGGISKKQGKSIKAFAKYWKIPKLLRLGRLLKYAGQLPSFRQLPSFLPPFLPSTFPTFHLQLPSFCSI